MDENELIKQYEKETDPNKKLEIEKQLLTQSDNRPKDDDPAELPDSKEIWEGEQ